MSYMNINYFLESVENEAITYPNITQDDIDTFKESIYAILADPNASTDGCIYDLGIWYICLKEGDDTELTAENLSLAIQDGESIEHFAGRVVLGQ